MPGWPAAGKTGTSQDFRDAWFVGYTANLVTGVWLGNDNSSPTRRATGGGLPVEIWSRFMRVAHQGVPVAALPGTAGAGEQLARRSAATWTPAGRQPSAPSPGAQPQRPPARRSGERQLDSWLLDTLFGRR